ncbi:sensor histidine kinase [Pseudofrankia saprophytica]|uniref:sensor histidine kinase n=1 Tax=Pseudofrankia saprophytica TaxID=298655 RepID=UPI000234B6D5|nr:ATP-binding protein [Pseudofrankia saprophytica]
MGVVERTEERLARMIAYTRSATSCFLFIPPVFAWDRLRHPWLAVAVALMGVVEAACLHHRLRKVRSTRDGQAIALDVGFSLLLMVIGSRAASADSRTTVMTVLLPFALVCPALLGFGVRRPVVGAAIVSVLGLGWSGALYPNYTVKIASDLLGFALWFVVATLIARELRSLAQQTLQSQQENARIERELSRRERETVVEHARRDAHRTIHDYLLPVVERVASGATDEPVHEAARQGVARARWFLADIRTNTPFTRQIGDVQSMFPEITTVIDIESDPPLEVADAVVAATREALTNVRKHAGRDVAAHLYVQATAGSVEIVVRDRGKGFDTAAVSAGGGLGRTFPAVELVGGTVSITSGDGTKVVIRWPG